MNRQSTFSTIRKSTLAFEEAKITAQGQDIPVGKNARTGHPGLINMRPHRGAH